MGRTHILSDISKITESSVS